MIEVTLDRYEALEAAIEGCRRRLRAIYAQAAQPLGYQEDHWHKDIAAAGAEIAFAKGTGRYWHLSLGAQAEHGDVAGGWEVRWSPHEKAHLLVYELDSDDRPYVLVTGDIPAYRLVGYLAGREAKRREWWRANGRVPCFWVPGETPPLIPVERPLAVAA